ncbi:helicase [Streptosporangium violaceochromogenes]|nr:helicase [Streptosporangium violaceochromogenes]
MTPLAPASRLWEHQAAAVSAATAALRNGSRAQVIMACGTGKTVVGAEVSHRLAPAGRTLIVVPTLDLLAQTARAYHAHLGGHAGRFVGVCSDAAALHHNVAAETVEEIRHLGAVTTDPGELAALAAAGGRLTVVTTYASLPVVEAAHRAGLDGWDLLVVDEAHRSAGRAERAWSRLHDDTHVPAARRLYLTATPRMMDSDRFETISMDDEAVFGPEAFRLPFAEAIKEGLLAGYRMVVSVVTGGEVAALAGGGKLVRLDGRTVPAQMLAAQIALLKAARTYGLERVITYHHRVLSAVRFAATLPNAAGLLPAGEAPGRPVEAEHVTGDHPAPYRRSVLERLNTPEGRLVVVSNARVLAEGVDVPELDGVMFADPRDSATDVVQAVGRALRKGRTAGKTATIIVPILLNGAESAEAALEGSAFDTVWRVVRALRAHDERLADWLDEHRVQLTTRDDLQAVYGRLPLPEWLHVTGREVPPGFAAALTVRAVQMTTSAWWDGYAAAQRYAAAHGHLDCPASYVDETGYRLGHWLANYRYERRNGRLSRRREALLEKLGMVWDPLDEQAQRWMRACRAFAQREGHLDVPLAHREGGLALGGWISKQRTRYQEGTLSPELAGLLSGLGMVWHDVVWERGIAAARAYHAEHGHLSCPKGVVAGGFELGDWLSSRRVDRRKGRLPEEKAAALEKLGIVWDPAADRWRTALEAARRYAAAHGHLMVPDAYVDETGYRLGKWIAHQRAKRRGTKKGQSISPEQISELDALGMVWRPKG